MSADASFSLATGRVTALLGPDAARRSVFGALDPGGLANVLTVSSGPGRTVAERITALAQAAGLRPVLVLVNRLTDGLGATDRRTVLMAVRQLADGGTAVLVDDADPVAALAVADGALRASADGTVAADDLATAPGPVR